MAYYVETRDPYCVIFVRALHRSVITRDRPSRCTPRDSAHCHYRASHPPYDTPLSLGERIIPAMTLARIALARGSRLKIRSAFMVKSIRHGEYVKLLTSICRCFAFCLPVFTREYHEYRGHDLLQRTLIPARRDCDIRYDIRENSAVRHSKIEIEIEAGIRGENGRKENP